MQQFRKVSRTRTIYSTETYIYITMILSEGSCKQALDTLVVCVRIENEKRREKKKKEREKKKG